MGTGAGSESRFLDPQSREVRLSGRRVGPAPVADTRDEGVVRDKETVGSQVNAMCDETSRNLR